VGAYHWAIRRLSGRLAATRDPLPVERIWPLNESEIDLGEYFADQLG